MSIGMCTVGGVNVCVCFHPCLCDTCVCKLLVIAQVERIRGRRQTSLSSNPWFFNDLFHVTLSITCILWRTVFFQRDRLYLTAKVSLLTDVSHHIQNSIWTAICWLLPLSYSTSTLTHPVLLRVSVYSTVWGMQWKDVGRRHLILWMSHISLDRDAVVTQKGIWGGKQREGKCWRGHSN